MKRSRNFWAGIVLLAIIPLLLIDIAEHAVNWKKEVREEMIDTIHNNYNITREEKAAVLERILDRNQTLNALIYLKSFACGILLLCGMYLLIRSRKEQGKSVLASACMAIGVMIIGIGVKLVAAGAISNNRIHVLPEQAGTLSLQEIHKQYYPNKLVYIDFWGTTCGPCLKEFRDYTRPLKKKYAAQANIAYLYISRGNRYIWTQQLKKYNVEGDHLFLDGNTYDKLYREAAKDSNVHITMPRYVIMGKEGNIVEPDARRPSDKDSLYFQIDRYLLSLLFPL